MSMVRKVSRIARAEKKININKSSIAKLGSIDIRELPSAEVDRFRIQGVKGSSENLLLITLESWNPRPSNPCGAYDQNEVFAERRGFFSPSPIGTINDNYCWKDMVQVMVKYNGYEILITEVFQFQGGPSSYFPAFGQRRLRLPRTLCRRQ